MDPVGHSVPFLTVLVMDQKDMRLSAIFREELHGQEITIRHIGVLSMIASWLLGERATRRLLANYFHLMDAGTTFDQSVTQDQQWNQTPIVI